MTLVIGHVPVSSGAGNMGHGELAGISFLRKSLLRAFVVLRAVAGTQPSTNSTKAIYPRKIAFTI